MSTLLRLATAGSVDDGKSTLVGRLLHDSRSVLTDQLDAVERVSRDRGLAAVPVVTDLADLLASGSISCDAHGAPAVPTPWSFA